MNKKKGLIFLKTPIGDEALGREFLESPENFAKKRGVSVEDLACPEATHAAMQRGNAFAADVAGRAITPTSQSMNELRELAAKHFGENFRVAMIPYGLQFSENAFASIDNTGSGTVTFLDGDGDVDEIQ